MTKLPTHPEREARQGEAPDSQSDLTDRQGAGAQDTAQATGKGSGKGTAPLPGKQQEDPGTVSQEGGGEPMPRLPHERDESHQSQHTGSRPVGRQAARDIERGLQETDLYGSRGRLSGAAAEDND